MKHQKNFQEKNTDKIQINSNGIQSYLFDVVLIQESDDIVVVEGKVVRMPSSFEELV